MISSNTIYSLVLLFLVTGCASTPVWVEGTDRNDFYYQGVGVGPSASQAERNASLDLCANIHGIEVEQVIEDYQRERSTRYELDTESSFQQWMSTYVEGRVPAEARIVERWKGQGQFWAYAIVEKPGQKKRIQRLYDRALEDVKLHSLLPGWAQFQKRQLHKGWLYIGGVSAGVIGGVSFAILSNDALERRDRSTRQMDRDHYDDLANRRFWISNTFYALAGGMYAINVLDGWHSRVEPYQILARVERGGVHLAVRF